MRKLAEQNQLGQDQYAFAATLLSVAEKALTNVNGKEYNPASIKFVDAHGKEQTTSCVIYAANLAKGMEVGKEYAATAAITPQGPFITLAPFAPNAERATVDMFATVATEVAAPANVNVVTGEIKD